MLLFMPAALLQVVVVIRCTEITTDVHRRFETTRSRLNLLTSSPEHKQQFITLPLLNVYTDKPTQCT